MNKDDFENDDFEILLDDDLELILIEDKIDDAPVDMEYLNQLNNKIASQSKLNNLMGADLTQNSKHPMDEYFKSLIFDVLKNNFLPILKKEIETLTLKNRKHE